MSKPKIARGRALARAQVAASHLAALPLERSMLPQFRRLAERLTEALDEAGMYPKHLECPDCDEPRNECVCWLWQ